MVVNKEFYENIPVGTQLFGRFLLERLVCASDSGAVYRCITTWGKHKGKSVALKVTTSEPDFGPNQEQLIREIKLLSEISHPNIVKAFDWFQDSTFTAYSMEYIEGGTLEELLEASPDRSVAWSLDLLTQLALGLQAIHSHGIVHRDIKPQNLLVTKSGQLKIADFGISVQARAKDKPDANQITGTIDFVSPEYIRHGAYDARSDIYAWGVLAYLMLTGHVPFEDESIVDALTRKATEDPVSPRVYRADIPEKLGHIILKSLARQPNQRFQTVTELLAALSSLSPRPMRSVVDKGDEYFEQIRRVA